MSQNINSVMKSASLLFYMTAIALCLLSISYGITGCGSKSDKTAISDTSDTNSSYVPDKTSVAFDPIMVDPNAPVMELKLNAVGNSMDVMTFSTQEIRVKAGTTVKLHFINTATDPAMKHNFFIVKYGTMEQAANASLDAGAEKNYIPDDKKDILFTSSILSPGQSEDLIFPAPPAGVYQFVCTYPGHWQKMNGKFIVE